MNQSRRQFLKALPVEKFLTAGQKRLKKMHGTPDKFARGCYEAVPGYISMGEAREAIKKYQKEWDSAK